MAIGKVNAYATVDAPKADFGAVAQLNIDNLVKSAKEDEQLKAAKKAAADKAKSEREKDLKLFPNVTATGATAVDAFYLQQSKRDFDLSNEYKRDWIENDNYESKAKYESLVHHYGDMNNQLASFGTQVTKFSEKAGDGKSLYKKNAEYGMDIVKSMNENRLRISRDDDGNVKFGIYKEEDGKMVLDKVVDQATYYKDINNPVPNIDIDLDAKATKGVYEKDLTEKYSGRTKTGVKELSEEAKKKIYEDCLSKVNDDNFAYVAGDVYGVIAKDDFKRSGFDKTEKESIARKHADKIIGMFGREETKDTSFVTPKGDGAGKEPKGQVLLSSDSFTRVGEGGAGSIIGYPTIGKTKAAVQVAKNAKAWSLNPSGLKNQEEMNSTIGGKSGQIFTPESLIVSNGELLISGSTSESMGYSFEGINKSGKQTGDKFVLSMNTNGQEFGSAIKGILNTQPTWDLPNGKTMKIRTKLDMYKYADELDRQTGGNGLKSLTKTVSKGDSGKTESGNTTKSVAEKMREAANSKTKK